MHMGLSKGSFTKLCVCGFSSQLASVGIPRNPWVGYHQAFLVERY